MNLESTEIWIQREKTLSDLKNRHLTILYNYGFLPKSAFDELSSFLKEVCHLIRIKHENRFIGLFFSTNIGELNKDSKEEVLLSKGFTKVIRHDCQLFFHSSADKHKHIFIDICEHANLIVHNTLIWKSMEKERLNIYTRSLQENLKKSGKLNIEVLARFVSEKINVEIKLIEKRSYRDGYKAGQDLIPTSSRSKKKQKKLLTKFVSRTLQDGSFSENACSISDLDSRLSAEALSGAKLMKISSKLASHGQKKIKHIDKILFPLCRSSDSRSTRTQLFQVSRKKNGLNQDDVYIIQELISYYFDKLLHDRQHRLIYTIVNEINKLNRSHVLRAQYDQNKFESILFDLLTEILWTTTAYRCSFWMYSARYHAFVPIVNVAYKKGEITDKLPFVKKSISARLFNTSAIVNCFERAYISSKPLYIDDTRNASKYMRKNGLKNLINPPILTQSELFVPIYQGATPIGVLYSESRLLDAFKQELWFFQSIASLISDFHTTIHLARDSMFVAEKLSCLDAYHELDGILDMRLNHDPELLKWIKEILDFNRNEYVGDMLEGKAKLVFLEMLDRLREDFGMQLKSVSNDIFSLIKLMPSLPDLFIADHKRRAIQFIIKNFISNAFRYKSEGSTSITIGFYRSKLIKSESEFEGFGIEGLLHIDCSIDPPLPQEILNDLGQKVVDSHGRTPRRGLLLVGIVSRQLGGTFQAIQDSKGQKTRLVIRIPIAAEEIFIKSENKLRG